MKKGVDYIGVTVSYFCHDGNGEYVFHKRGANCRDEHGRWDCGGGGVKFGETVENALHREIKEEFGADILSYSTLGYDDVFREQEGHKTHWISFRFLVHLDREQVYNAEPEKHDDLGWFTLDKIPKPWHSQLEAELEKYKDFLK